MLQVTEAVELYRAWLIL